MQTGDLATIDDEGLCDIVGRIKELVIRGVEIVDAFPMTVTGKMQKPLMREAMERKLGLVADATA